MGSPPTGQRTCASCWGKATAEPLAPLRLQSRVHGLGFSVHARDLFPAPVADAAPGLPFAAAALDAVRIRWRPFRHSQAALTAAQFEAAAKATPHAFACSDILRSFDAAKAVTEPTTPTHAS